MMKLIKVKKYSIYIYLRIYNSSVGGNVDRMEVIDCLSLIILIYNILMAKEK